MSTLICPYCKKSLPAFAPVQGRDFTPPSDGDLAVCFGCGGIIRHVLTLVTVTDAELDTLANESEENRETIQAVRLHQLKVRSPYTREAERDLLRRRLIARGKR